LMEAGGVRGARGVLINITGSSRLSLHEVNEACTLIREAAQNDDVQINFGVVLNESMADQVKITVIATGFQRENLPAIERKPSRVAASAEPAPAPRMEVPEPAHVEPPAPQPAYEEPPLPVAAAPAPPEPVFDDLDVPAILRRDRRMIQ